MFTSPMTLILFDKKAMFKFGASEMRYQNLRANNMVMWEAIKWCLEMGCTTLSLGRTEPGNAGLLQFKRGWGASPKAFKYYRYDVATNKSVKETSAFGTSKRYSKYFHPLF
jgi:lipid II:glycine glycyltransferase (peptidoglycan interpeptide bridge formation enzyme)